jgi:hypothetical protein
MRPRSVRTSFLSVALVLAAPVALAGGGEDEWLSLDREIEALSRSIQADAPAGLRMGLLVRSNYAHFDESPFGPGTTYSGFVLDNVRAWFEGDIGSTTAHISFEAQSGTAQVLDAWASTRVGELFRATMGQFQPAVLRSALVDPQNQLFILRSGPGAFWQRRDVGVQLAAELERLLIRGSLENGADGAGDEFAYSVRADWAAAGGGVPLVEGTYGSGRKTCLSVGASYHSDENALLDGDVMTADAALTTDRFSLAAEFQDYGDDGAIYGTFADTAPWAASASFMIDPEKYEIGVRYEDLDDANEVKAVTVGLNRYFAGHDLMWQFNFATVDSDSTSQDGNVFAIGLTANV